MVHRLERSFLLALLPLTACAARRDGGAGAAFVLRQWSAPCGVGVTPRCEVADSAWQWRELRAAVPELARCELACSFATERLVAVVVPQAGLAPPVDHERHRDEDVDVIVIVPTPSAPADPGIVHVLVVPAGPAPLALVLRVPGVDAGALERTLAVFPGR